MSSNSANLSSYIVGDDAYIVPRADVGIRPYELQLHAMRGIIFQITVIPREQRDRGNPFPARHIRAPPSSAKNTDCHAASLLAMTEIKVSLRGLGRLRALPVADEASKKEWQRSKFGEPKASNKFWAPQQDHNGLRVPSNN